MLSQIDLVICSIMSVLVLGTGLFLLAFLYRQRYTFPYSNMSVRWVLLLLISKQEY